MLQAIYKDFEAVKFIKNEFKDDYDKFYNKYNKIRSKHDCMSFYHYKDYAIVNLFLIYNYDDYINFLKTNNLQISLYNI